MACPEQNRKPGIVLAWGLALMLMQGVAMAGIATTKHNLSSTNTLSGTPNKFNGTTEICVFCHTPHGANTSAPVPLWNRNFTAASAYTTYASLGTATLDGQTATTGSVSLACLSCHDGTQAMDIMINTPGSGTAALSGAWSGTNQTAGKITGAFTNTGVDLTNDHPIGIQYGGGRAAAYETGTDYAAGTTIDADFKAIKAVTGKAMWYVDTNGNGTHELTDLSLYTRTDVLAYDGVTAITGGAQPYVECASCHDPHINNTTFLRISNNGSAVCLACHTK